MNATDDWYDVEEIGDGSYRIVEGEMFGMFLVTGADVALVIDGGVGAGDLPALVSDLADPPARMFLTHTHWDHMGAASQFDTVLVDERETAPDGGVAVDGLTDEFTERPRQFVEGWLADGNEFPDGFDPDAFDIPPVSPSAVELIAPGETLDLGGRTLELVDLPGHSPGQVGALDRDAGVLYGSDVIHVDYGLYVHFERSDAHAYLDTLDRLVDLRDEGAFDTLQTSHNAPLSGDDLALIDELRDGLAAIIDDEPDYEVVETSWGEAREYDVAGSPVVIPRDGV